MPIFVRKGQDNKPIYLGKIKKSEKAARTTGYSAALSRHGYKNKGPKPSRG